MGTESLAIIAGLFAVLGAWAVGTRPRRGKSSGVARRHRRYRAKGERVRQVLAQIEPINGRATIAYLRKIPPLAFEELILASPQGLFAKPRFVGQNWNIRHAPAPTGLASDLFATCDQPVT